MTIEIEIPTRVILILGLFIILVFVLGTHIGAYYTEQDIKEKLCRKECQQAVEYLLCKDKSIGEVLK